MLVSKREGERESERTWKPGGTVSRGKDIKKHGLRGRSERGGNGWFEGSGERETER